MRTLVACHTWMLLVSFIHCLTWYMIQVMWLCYCRWFSNSRSRYLWHNAVCVAAGGHVVCWPSSQHGLIAADGWQPRHAPFPAKLSHHGPPAVRPCNGELSELSYFRVCGTFRDQQTIVTWWAVITTTPVRSSCVACHYALLILYMCNL